MSSELERLRSERDAAVAAFDAADEGRQHARDARAALPPDLQWGDGYDPESPTLADCVRELVNQRDAAREVAEKVGEGWPGLEHYVAMHGPTCAEHSTARDPENCSDCRTDQLIDYVSTVAKKAYAGEHRGSLECLFEKGDRVRIRKGARVFSTLPSWPNEGKVMKRSIPVTVHRGADGYVCDGEIKRPQVWWVGSGSYYRWTDAAFVELA